MENLLDIRNLTIKYQSNSIPAVQNINVQIKQGHITCLVGESGSGKTSIALALLRMLPTFSNVTGGAMFKNIDLLQCPLETMKQLRGNEIYYLSQSPMNAFNSSIKIGKQLYAMVGKKLKLGKVSFFQQLEELLEKLHITDPKTVLQQYPFQLSGGMLQRISIAAAFLLKPSLIIADEPTSSLDVDVQKEILQLITDSKNGTNTTYLIITHDFGVVAEIADNVIVMRNGQVVEENDVFTLFNHPSNDYTKKLLEAAF